MPLAAPPQALVPPTTPAARALPASVRRLAGVFAAFAPAAVIF